MINFDANATYGTDPEVLREAVALIDGALNPSSIHAGGQRARALMEQARDDTANLVNARKSYRVVFCSGATEANNMVINHAAESGRYIVSSKLEHPSVVKCVEKQMALGNKGELLNPGAELTETLAEFIHSSEHERSLLCCMLANNETGQRFDVRDLNEKLKSSKKDVWLHTDAVQLCGKDVIDIEQLGVDSMSISGHKFGGLAGVGALVVNTQRSTRSLIVGGPQELHNRAGTENLLGIVSMGVAARRVAAVLDFRKQAMLKLREYFEAQLTTSFQDVNILAADLNRLPNTSCFSLPGCRGDDLVVGLDVAGFCISSGAACASGKQEASPVVMAMGYSESAAKEFVRVSFRHDSTCEEVDLFLRELVNYVERTGSLSGVSHAY